MSTSAIGPQANTATEGGLWFNRSSQSRCGGLTQAEAQRVALRTLGVVASGTGIGLVYLAAIGSIVPQTALFAIPCVILALGTFLFSSSLHDYENPEELQRFRKDAARMSLEGVVSAHGWKNILRWGMLSPDVFTVKFRQHLQGKNLSQILDYYENVTRQIAEAPFVRYDYQLPSPREYRAQWRAETATLTFEEIIKRYPLDKLERYGIVETGEIRSLRNLKRDYEAIRGNYKARKAQIIRDTEDFKRTRDTEFAAAHQRYNENPVVIQLQGIEMDYVRQRQVVQDVGNQRKTEAFERYNRVIMPLTNNGQIPYARLAPREQAVYHQQNIELQTARANADNDVRQQIAQIDTRYVIERGRLNAEEPPLREQRDQLLRTAQEKYDRDVAPHLTPIKTVFRNAVNDLNGRYRAYLRMSL